LHMKDDDLVYGVVYGGRARAYPRWIMIGYHIANDTIDGQPLMVTQCEVCSSASAFVPTIDVPPFGPLAFVPCGFHGGTFQMCDITTNSRWQPFSGKAFAGLLKGKTLNRRVPVVVQKWKDWRKAYPDTDVVLASARLRDRPHSHGDLFNVG